MMELDPLTVVAVLGMASLLIERVFYYRSRYKKRNNKTENPTYGERIKGLEVKVEGLEESNENDHELIRKENEKDHELIRRDIRKIFNLINGMKK